MLSNHAATFVVATQRLTKIAEILQLSILPGTEDWARDRMLQEERELLADLDLALEGLQQGVAWFDMPSVIAQIEAIRILRIADPPTERERIAEEAYQLIRRLKEALEARWFYYLPYSHVAFYQRPHVFGNDFAEAFPSAVFDSVEAAKCLALGRSTACVLHLMRVIDGCVQNGLNPRLGITSATNWGAYIRAINDRIRTRPTLKKVVWKRDAAFYESVVENLHGIKVAWRNPSMHEVAQFYSDEDAGAILICVKRFVTHLATRVAEPRPRRR